MITSNTLRLYEYKLFGKLSYFTYPIVVNLRPRPLHSVLACPFAKLWTYGVGRTEYVNMHTPYGCNQSPTPGARKRKRSSEALVVSYCEAWREQNTERNILQMAVCRRANWSILCGTYFEKLRSTWLGNSSSLFGSMTGTIDEVDERLEFIY